MARTTTPPTRADTPSPRMIEYDDRNWAVRFAEALMPKVANGINLDADLGRARSENLEVELAPRRCCSIAKACCGLLALRQPSQHGDLSRGHRQFSCGTRRRRRKLPTIRCRPTTNMASASISNSHSSDWSGLFGRWGWNEGQHESYAYTEVDDTVEFGAWA